VVDALLPTGASFVPSGASLGADGYQSMRDQSIGLRGPAALRFLWEDFIVPTARAMVPDLVRTIDDLRPDVVLVDQQAVGGAIAARLHGVPWATSATTSAELTDPLAALPKIDHWVRDQLVGLQLQAGVDPALARHGDLRFSEQLVLAFTTPELVGAEQPFPAHYRFVGPLLAGRVETSEFPEERLDPTKPHVLVSLGTLNAAQGQRFLAVAAEALAGEALQAIIVAPPDLVDLPPSADNIIVVERVPQLRLLPAMDAVVSHGGHNTVCEALSHGLPLVLAPIRDDQPIVADQVVRAGAGLRVKFGRVQPPELRAAVWRALTDRTLRIAAQALQTSFQRAGGVTAAADALEALRCPASL
jgi:MGT family glycosyltransferase